MLNFFSDKAAGSEKHKNFQFWQEGNHAIEVFTHDFVWTKINNIHNNPVKSRLVKEPHHWIYSSASNYQDMESVFFVEKIVHKLITYL
jgi:hypothetical protein